MALLPPLANATSVPGVDAHYSSHVGVSGTESPDRVILSFHGEETFQTPVVELNDSGDSEEELPAPRGRRKRLVRRHTESSGELVDMHRIKTIRRKSRLNYHESDSSSEGERDYVVATKPELPYGVIRGCPNCPTCQKVLATWRVDAGRRPCIEDAPVFYPTEEEFQHPLKYISKIRAKAELHGICRVVPPQSWKPPCPLRGDSAEAQNIPFPTRVQQVHKLQVRQPTAECSSTKQTKKRRGREVTGGMGESATFPTPPANDQPGVFGFGPGVPFLLGAFEKYAHDFKDQYFRISERQSANSEQRWEPSVENIEGEYWRIVEQATEQIEVLYGADVETGTFGSGFPKPLPGSEATTLYEKSGWNLNNIARYPGSVLSFEEEDISGVLVPWLYVGMCFSSFCWHVEDHHFYSINYMHWGAPKVWYGVPGSSADLLEAAMKKHLPDLFSEQPDLLQKLVTQLSPSFLKQEGVPVYRVVQQPGDFVITFPNAYHCGFNSGFNVAEAVNVAPVDWLPHGQAAVERYRDIGRRSSVSHDKLLLGAARLAMGMWCNLQQNEKPLLGRDRAGGLEPGLVCAWRDYCGEGGMLANALKARVDMERTRRESLKSRIGLALSVKQMDSIYDSADERECESCKYDLHLSALGCECCPGKFACLLHGDLLCSCPWSKKTLFYRYPLEQLNLLLAAVEGRPEAVANWAKENGQKPSQSPPVVVPFEVTLENDVMNRPQSCTSPAVTETQKESRTVAITEEMASQYVKTPDKTDTLARNPLISVRSSVQAMASCEKSEMSQHNPNRFVSQQSKDLPSHSQKVVFLRSGYARRAAASKIASERAGSSKSSLYRLPGGDLGSSRQSAPSTSENQRVNVPTSGVILLSDDEEEMIPCALNEATESSFSAHEMQNNLPSGVPECAMDNKLSAQGHLTESKVDLCNTRCSSLSKDLTMHSGSSAQIEKEENPSQVSVRAASASGGNKEEATARTCESPVKNRSLHCLTSAKNVLKPIPDGNTDSPNPVTDVVTIVQRGRGNTRVLPRVARARKEMKVELLEVGRLVVREGWHTSHAIYPAGFKSRICFVNVEDILKTCSYVSEIIDRGPGNRPLFQVTHETKPEVYAHEFIDGCWHAIQNQINDTIISLRCQNSDLQLPPLLPPPNGVEMFGLTSISIIEAVDALDPLHQCTEYWNSKQTVAKQNSGLDSEQPDIRKAGMDVADLNEDAQELPSKELRTRTPQNTSVNTSTTRPMNNSSTNKPSSQALVPSSLDNRRIVPRSLPRNDRPDTYSTMQGLFQRASQTELIVLYRLLTAEVHGEDWGSAFRALTEEVREKFLG